MHMHWLSYAAYGTKGQLCARGVLVIIVVLDNRERCENNIDTGNGWFKLDT